MVSSKNSSTTSSCSESSPKAGFGFVQENKPNSVVFTRYKCISGHRKVFNFNRFSTIKTIGMGLLVASLTVHSSLKIRKLLSMSVEEKWKYPLLGFFLLQLGLLVLEECLLIFLGLLNVQNPSKQRVASRANVLSSILVLVVSVLNIITNHINEETIGLEGSCT